MRTKVGWIIAIIIALPLALAGVAPAAGTAAQYGGTTHQKEGGAPLQITLAVKRGRLAGVQVAVLLTKGATNCASAFSGGRGFDFVKGKVKVHKGKFAGKLGDGHGNTMTISGRFKGKRVKGVLLVTTTKAVVGIPVCNSGKVKFSAKAAGGQVDHSKYSGSIGPGYPISFTVSKDGKTIDGLVLKFENTCQPGAGNTPGTFTFKPLPISSGSFSGAVTNGAGTNVSDALRISGSFFGRTATGTVTDTAHIKSLPDCTISESFTATAN
jgi:hypothetical protein